VDEFLDYLTSHPSNIKCLEFLEYGLKVLHECQYNVDEALITLNKVASRNDIGISEWSGEDMQQFEFGISQFGHDLHLVAQEVLDEKGEKMGVLLYMYIYLYIYIYKYFASIIYHCHFSFSILDVIKISKSSCATVLQMEKN